MYKVSKAKSLLSNEEIEKKIKNTKGFWRVQKWLIIHNAVNYPRSAKEIAGHLSVSVGLVHKTVSEFNKQGASSIDKKGKGGRWNSYLSIDEEERFLSEYIKKAQNGQVATAQIIKESFEKYIGRTVHISMIYRLLRRHNWRKIVPLPHHPKRNKQAQEAFKKTSAIK